MSRHHRIVASGLLHATAFSLTINRYIYSTLGYSIQTHACFMYVHITFVKLHSFVPWVWTVQFSIVPSPFKCKNIYIRINVAMAVEIICRKQRLVIEYAMYLWPCFAVSA